MLITSAMEAPCFLCWNNSIETHKTLVRKIFQVMSKETVFTFGYRHSFASVCRNIDILRILFEFLALQMG